jgi:uncharacterized protein
VTTFSLVWIGSLLALVALLYSSVGHAGASGYIAVMLLAGLAPEAVRPIALMLNIFVATVASWQFAQQGHFSWRLFWPFGLGAVPFAFLGGYLKLPDSYFHVAIGAVLLFSSARLVIKPREVKAVSNPKLEVAIPAGAALGLLAGLTGTGGGIFLTPVLLAMNWATPKTAGASSAVFILLNSIAGLLGHLSHSSQIPPYAWKWSILVVAAGFFGSRLGSKHLSHETLKRLLAVVLLIAGLKLIQTGMSSP